MTLKNKYLIMTPTQEDKFKGCLIGLAAGDALGGPVEEIPKHPSPVQRPIYEMIGGGYLNLLPGQITDDTEMALCIARSIAEKKYFDPEDIAKRFVHWFDDNMIGAGSTTRAAIKRLKEGFPWYEAGYNQKGITLTGNGSVMRCAPVGMYDYKNITDLIKHSKEQSIITHPHQDCIDSSIFINSIIAYCLENKNGRDSYSSYNDGGLKYDAYDEALTKMIKIGSNDLLLAQYGAIGSVLEPDKYLKQKLSGTVYDTVDSAVYCLLSTWTFEECILKAVNLGGDADTRGAMAGAMAGACYGETAIPEQWKEKLVDRNGKQIYSELCDLSQSIYQLAQR